MKKHRTGVHVETNAFVDAGDGLISFPNGQVITDNSTQRNGTRYDIESMDLSEYKGQVTADHFDMINSVIGKALGLAKREAEVVISGIQFAVKENALARVAYDLMVGGFPLDLSIETYGPWPDESDNTYYKAKLIGLSVVVVGNNRSATMNQLVYNSMEQAKQDGLDISDAEKVLNSTRIETEPGKPTEIIVTVKHENSVSNKDKDMKFVTVKNGRGFAVKVTYKNAAGEDTETEVPDGGSLDVSEDQQEAVEKQINSAEPPKVEKKSEKAEDDDTTGQPPKFLNDIKEAIDKAVAPIKEKVEAIEQNAFDKGVKEPEFQTDKNAKTAGSKLGSMDWRERTGEQVRNLYAGLKGNSEAMKKARDINSFNLEALQKDGKVSNALTLTDLGNFVIPPEMVSEIAGFVTNYRPLLDRFNFQETLSLQTSWIERTGEITMSDVEMEEDGANGDLKPISEPTYDTHSTTLKEFAAVTPVDASAVRFSAVDIVQDITAMYRRAYDRALAQSVIGRLEKAIESNGNSVIYDYSSGGGGNVGALLSLLTAWSEVAEHTPNGVYIMNTATYLHLLGKSLQAGISSPLANIFTQGPDGVPRFFSLPYLVVPGDLLPTVNTAGTKSWTFEEVSVTVNHAIILADPANFKGRVSGGLNFQVSTEAAYEENSTVKSAFQRDKLLFRGYGYRASAVTQTDDVAGVLAPGVS